MQLKFYATNAYTIVAGRFGGRGFHFYVNVILLITFLASTVTQILETAEANESNFKIL